MIAAPRFFLISLALLISASVSSAVTSSTDPDKDPQMTSLLQEARRLINAKKPAAAVEKCDQIITAFKARYANSKQKIMCGRTSTEVLGSLLQAAADKNNAIALSPTWADAYYMKAYALQDLGRLSEAKSNVQLALAMSPFNSQYRSELGEIYQLEKNWAKAKQEFAEAEDNAEIAPEDSKADELGRARRGLAYVFVELGKLDEAEKKYQQCLATDPKDTRARRELDYVRGLKAKKKSR
jgi:tetratricopeptide (TPR) repeat protein